MRTVPELKTHLRDRGFNPLAYSFYEDLNETYVLVGEHDRWSVYYSERGRRVQEKVYWDQSEACLDLLHRLENDPTTRMERPPNEP
jgi:hypothetical protein